LFKREAFKSHMAGMGRYIGWAFVLFFAGMVIGGTQPELKQFLDGQLAGLEQLRHSIDQSDNPTWTMMWIIFLNNAIKSVLVLFLGAFFGILPIVFLLINGMVIGYLLTLVSNEPTGPAVWEVIVKGLLPHGIIEVPAVVIACAYGMKFGSLTLRSIGCMLFRQDKLDKIGEEFAGFMKWTAPVAAALVVSLLAASVIESTLTVWLLTL
jgi:Uncharacterized membrane protein